MEERKTCPNCGSKLRPGARFCSSCGSIVRNTEPVNPQVVEEPKQVERPTTEDPRRINRKEYIFNEKPGQTTGKIRKYREDKESLSFDIAGDNIVLWNALTSVSSLIALILGIILLSVTFMSFKFETYNIALSMNDCLNVLFSKDMPLFCEIVDYNLVSGLLSGIGVMGLMYLIVSIVYVGYNVVMYGKYNKLMLIINSAFSGALTVFAIILMVLYIMLTGKCTSGGVPSGTTYNSFAIILLILTVLVLLFDVAKATLLYQKKSAEKEQDSYILGFITKLGRNMWKIVSIAAGSLGLIALIVIVLLATAKSPAIKVWENYVDAFNKENATNLAGLHYSAEREEYKDVEDYYKELFAGENNQSLTVGKAELTLRTEKYINVKVKDVKYNDKNINVLNLHFAKVSDKWYLMSYIDFDKKGNVVEINDFNKEVASTILKITDTTVHGFSAKFSKTDKESIKQIIIPEYVTVIEDDAFSELTSLETVIMGNAVTTIGKNAFKGCVSLKNIITSTKLTSIGGNAFAGCNQLESIVLASSVAKVGENAFTGCENLSIYTGLTSLENLPAGFNPNWNPNNCKVYLNTQWNNNLQNPSRFHLLTVIANGGEYELDGDEYYENGVFANISNPTKLGCEFLGWYDNPEFTGERLGDPSIPLPIKMEGDVTIYAKWNENTYKIEYELNGGELANKVPSYTVEDEIELGKPTKLGHTFLGWYDNPSFTGEAITTIKKGTTGALKFYAKFTANYYKLTLDGNDGKTSANKDTVVVDVLFGKTYQLTANVFTFKGMEQIGWNTKADGTGTTYQTVQQYLYNEAENVTLYAMWASKITLNPGSHATYEGSIPRITVGMLNYTLPVPTTKQNLFFAGWFLGEQQITNSEGKGIVKWEIEDKVTLTAKWVDTIMIDNVSYLYRGEYPQSRVTDSALIETLKGLKSKTNSRGYIEYNGEQYARILYSNATTKAKFNDGTELKHGAEYFFKVEKILWRVLDNQELFLVSDLVLDVVQYYDDNETRTYDDPSLGNRYVYPNNFVFSTINAWLNNDKVNRLNLDKDIVDYTNSGFATKSFGDNVHDTVQWTLDIDNSAESTSSPSNANVWGNSEAYFYPLSYKEVEKDYKDKLDGGAAGATDYAIAKDVEFNTETKTASWWLRSPHHSDTSRKFALFVNTSGNIVGAGRLVNDETTGVRPAMHLRPGK